ncbi:tyrosine-type recombinase/integrase [Pseudonocardia adelaidensis]|uniref:Tyrosine-type recombinase/integrase n=1 Tax=Pseudonocardia adelaidensis TaxID=648754 RepID=A0ABP9NRD0_9PSEU
MSRGGISKRCGCTEVVDGKRRQLGARCPKLRRSDGSWNPRHGTWAFTTTVRGKGGKPEPIRRSGFASQTEAQRELDKIRDKARRGVVVTDVTVGAYLEEWLGTKSDIAAGTVRSYAAHIRNYHAPHLGHLRMDDLRVAHVAEMLAEVPFSDATRQRVRATLRSALNDAIREGLLMVNPAALVKLPAGKRPKALVWTAERVQRWRQANELLAACEPDAPEREQLELAAQPPSPVMVWTPAQLGQFLDAAHDDRLYAMWHLIAHRGLRRGEACGVEWSDVDLTAGTVAVRRQLVQLGWEVAETRPKSEAGERTVALDAGTVAALQAHRKRQMEDRLAWGPAWVETGKVFVRENGETLHPARVTDWFHAIAEAAGLPPIRLHDLRHGAASLMLAAGVDMKVVQETLGHSSSAITSDTYTSVYPKVAAAAAEAAAALVPRQATGTGMHTPRTYPASAGQTRTGNAWSEGGPPGDRTLNPRIKSPLLCRLS